MKLNEILTTIGIIIALTLSIINLFNTYLVEETPDLSIQSFPQELSSFNTNEDIEFTFFLYNEGEKPAFIDYIYAGNSNFIIEPQMDFVISAYDTYPISITLPAKNKELEEEIQFEVYFGPGNQKIRSEKITVKWGTL
ncbi:hypothetical protein CL616_02970 [archaeon]|nr:hypothetical protein [archaeon]